MITFDIPQEWLKCFSEAETPEQWDRILAVAMRRSPAVYSAAIRACNNRDTRSLKRAAARERCREKLDNMV